MVLFKKILNGIEKVLSVIVGLDFIAITLLVSAEIFSRYILRNSIRGSYELSRYLVIWMVFLSTGIGLRRAELTSIKYVLERFPLKISRIIMFIGNIMMACFIIIAIIYGTKILDIVKGQLSPGLGLNMAFAYLAIPVGCLFILIFIIEGIINIVNMKSEIN